ncbi:MAG: GNAT family N-acetyltransferase [Bacteroidetes bacterium]|nr:GNAT family N-acetyltransferase [Bacteroidota bacterium]MBP7400449.1 GNAT family N-acetyltransferase [Chitinophagales bacterium]MBK7110797.1 GNAT family N-acetyltransferase [Bacteroidota bacterium]MBK8487983.1 GNAT family N-acetyltransferase [Bacteroidota bacterium]MBK8682259.1 GNAT family N-acetyltransferase [Bacteroidota bacterium]
MSKTNLDRMMQMVSDFFDVQNDPQQLQVDETIISTLIALHPASVSELDYGDGPVAWILLIPTTIDVMHSFLNNTCNEQDLLNNTSIDSNFNALYLCSAIVLPEYQQQGIARQLTLKAIEEIQKTYAIEYLFYWPFSAGGIKLAESIAKSKKLKLYKRQK